MEGTQVGEIEEPILGRLSKTTGTAVSLRLFIL
jgi:hypothetical protein